MTITVLGLARVLFLPVFGFTMLGFLAYVEGCDKRHDKNRSH